jgi:hypothetical protein
MRAEQRFDDELDEVAGALNRMRERTLEYVEARTRHEAELEQHRERLEGTGAGAYRGAGAGSRGRV